MEPEPAGKKAVSVGVVKNVARPRSHAGERTGHQIRPQVEVRARIADDGGFAGGARGGVQAQQLLPGYGEQPEGKIVAQVGLRREWQARDVTQRLHLLGSHPGGIELTADMCNPGMSALDRLLEPMKLQRCELVMRAWSRPRDRA